MVGATAVLLLLGIGPATAQDTLYVDADATGDSTGTSWTDAYAYLRNALDAAASTDQIWIASGMYYPDERDSDTAGSAEAFRVIVDSLKIYGGFEGTESTLDERDLSSGDMTVLSGDIDQDDDPFAPETDSDNNTSTPPEIDHINGANSNHVVVITTAAATVLDGVAVTGGEANSRGTRGIGGGLYCVDSNPQISNVLFYGNTADFEGGAIQNDSASPLIINAVFVGNQADTGGAIYNDGGNGQTSSPSIVNALFTDNRADGGAIYNDGEDGTSSPQITNATFTDNSAPGDFGTGGAIYNDGRGGTSSPQITNTVLWADSASFGDEVYNNGSGATPTISHTLIEGGLSGIAGRGGSSTNDGGGNLDADPMFVDTTDAIGGDSTFATSCG